MGEIKGLGRLTGRVAIVTGGSRGIGKAIAQGFAREGARVVITGRTQLDVDQAASELRASGATGLGLRSDVARPDEVSELVDTVLARFGQIDILMNNAGIPMVAPSDELALEGWNRALEINLTGVFLCAQAVGKVMLQQGRGSIINMASISSFLGFPLRVAYAATKTAELGVTRVLATEWAGRGVRVNAIAPGVIETEGLRKLAARGLTDPSAIAKRTPIGRLGQVEDVVGPAIFLASDESAFITGQTIVVDGGWLAAGMI